MFCLNFVQSWLQSKTFAAEIKSFWLYSSLLVSWCQYRLISHCSRRFNPHNSRRHNLPQAFCSRSILEPDTVQRKILWVLQSRVFVSKCGVAAGGVVAAALLLPSLSLGIISVGKFRLRCLQQLSSWLTTVYGWWLSEPQAAVWYCELLVTNDGVFAPDQVQQ